jgi:tRNA pseudouridine55 synthase
MLSESLEESKLASGILLVDKPIGPTSHDIVMIARKVLNTKKIGHCGTLDPLASGLLVLCIGKATKLIKYLTQDVKAYDAEVILGYQTDTDDITGKVIKRSDPLAINDAEIISKLESVVGVVDQIPPQYAAIKVAGKKLYEYARENREMPIVKPRRVEVIKVENIMITRDESLAEIRVKFSCLVSKGTYIRAMARDLGLLLDSAGTLASLRRTQVGSFTIDQAVSLIKLKQDDYELKDALSALRMPFVVFNDFLIAKVMNGQPLLKDEFLELTDTIIYDENKRPIAIYCYDEGKDIMRMSVKLI